MAEDILFLVPPPVSAVRKIDFYDVLLFFATSPFQPSCSSATKTPFLASPSPSRFPPYFRNLPTRIGPIPVYPSRLLPPFACDLQRKHDIFCATLQSLGLPPQILQTDPSFALPLLLIVSRRLSSVVIIWPVLPAQRARFCTPQLKISCFVLSPSRSSSFPSIVDHCLAVLSLVRMPSALDFLQKSIPCPLEIAFEVGFGHHVGHLFWACFSGGFSWALGFWFFWCFFWFFWRCWFPDLIGFLSPVFSPRFLLQSSFDFSRSLRPPDCGTFPSIC